MIRHSKAEEQSGREDGAQESAATRRPGDYHFNQARAGG